MPKDRGKDDWQIGTPGQLRHEMEARGPVAPRPDASPFAAGSLFSVAGRVALVTGGGSGIGSMVAAGYVANGAKVFVVSRKDCSALAAELTARGPGTCTALRVDVADPESVKGLAEEIQSVQGARGIDW